MDSETLWIDYIGNVYINVGGTWLDMNKTYTDYETFEYHLPAEYLAEIKRFRLAEKLQENI